MRAATFAWSMGGCLLLGLAGCGGSGGAVYEVQQQQKGFLDLIGAAIDSRSMADAKEACDKAAAKQGMSSQDKTSYERLCATCAAGNWEKAKEQVATMRGKKGPGH